MSLAYKCTYACSRNIHSKYNNTICLNKQDKDFKKSSVDWMRMRTQSCRKVQELHFAPLKKERERESTRKLWSPNPFAFLQWHWSISWSHSLPNLHEQDITFKFSHTFSASNTSYRSLNFSFRRQTIWWHFSCEQCLCSSRLCVCACACACVCVGAVALGLSESNSRKPGLFSSSCLDH